MDRQCDASGLAGPGVQYYYVGPRAVIPDILNSSSRCFCCRSYLRVCLVLLRVETYPLVEITDLREVINCCLLVSYLCSSGAHLTDRLP